jgi:3'-phosphoadenosine 5'-phosphosulfate sulfotransferase (PAPS reductase)/FAD synthetase
MYDPTPLVGQGALFVINHSGGKDSQAMTAVLRAMIPDEQLLVIHASLGEVEWPGVIDHIKATTEGLPLIVCKNENKTFLEMVERRGMFPSPQQRQCTSDLKRDPINREIRRYLRDNPRFGGRVVNCMGLRAEESSNRAKATPIKLSPRHSKAGRTWWDWLPIHKMTLDEVWETIEDAGQKPHFAYSLGMTRLSCIFCIMASDGDLTIAAKHNPQMFARYSDLEQRLGRTMMMPRKGIPRTLAEITGLTPELAA